MKNLKSLALFYTGIFTISILLHSCCLDKDTITFIGGGEITFIQNSQIAGEGSSIVTTLTGAAFSMSIEMEVDVAENYNNQGLMTPVYGVTCEPDFVNTLDESTFSLTCDKDFSFNGEIISAGTHFGELDGLLVSVNTISTNITVQALAEFMEKVEFTNGEHEFTISITTSDDIETESKGKVGINI